MRSTNLRNGKRVAAEITRIQPNGELRITISVHDACTKWGGGANCGKKSSVRKVTSRADDDDVCFGFDTCSCVVLLVVKGRRRIFCNEGSTVGARKTK